MNRELKVIDLAVRKKQLIPRFYVIGGSDIYGFKSDVGSDIDLRGFHMADSDDFLRIDHPKEQIIINQGKATIGFESYPDIELVSYELRKFGKLVSVMNFNVLEWIFCGKPIANGVRMEMDKLRDEILTHLPGNVPYHYAGMARQNYYKFLDRRNSECYKPTAKKFLYVLRGLLGAYYVGQEASIESDITVLNTATIDNPIIDELIRIKKTGEDVELPKDKQDEARSVIMSVMGDFPKASDSNTELNKFVDEWMLGLRK